MNIEIGRGAAIESIKWKGTELLDQHDLGRIFQTDMIEGTHSKLRENINPTQAGTIGGVESEIIWAQEAGDIYKAVVKPLDFTPERYHSAYRDQYIKNWPETAWILGVEYRFFPASIDVLFVWKALERRYVRELRVIAHLNPAIFQITSLGEGWGRDLDSWVQAKFPEIKQISAQAPAGTIMLEVDNSIMQSRHYSTSDMVKLQGAGSANVANIFGSRHVMRWAEAGEQFEVKAKITLRDWNG